jgi:hypothetical protein
MDGDRWYFRAGTPRSGPGQVLLDQGLRASRLDGPPGRGQGGAARPCFISFQPPYSILRRVMEREHFPMTRKLGIGNIVWSPLEGGWLSGKYRQGAPNPKDSARSEKWIGDVLNPKFQKRLDVAPSRAARRSTGSRRSPRPRSASPTPALPSSAEAERGDLEPRPAEIPIVHCVCPPGGG